jgi:hypothetical protein
LKRSLFETRSKMRSGCNLNSYAFLHVDGPKSG